MYRLVLRNKMSNPLSFYAAVGGAGYLMYSICEANRKQTVARNETDRSGYSSGAMQDHTVNNGLTRSEHQRVRKVDPEGVVVNGKAIRWRITNLDGSNSWVHMTPQKLSQKFKTM